TLFRSPDRLLLVRRDEAPRFISEVLHPRRDNGTAVNARQRALLAEIVEILANRLRRDFETARQIFHHDATGGARDVENVSLALGENGHGKLSGQAAPW